MPQTNEDAKKAAKFIDRNSEWLENKRLKIEKAREISE